ncbi:hypothetical protein DE4587_00263 [Mycobacteroides salmoniphilum]|nr:hypothetical protein DE4586_00347 [Mycobacteroides salmoniphilum]TDZ87912.1 hypothetical protein DE4587_00263 [Mycobacteroides salmoniphilum]
MLVHADSGAIEGDLTLSRSAPAISICMSSPRAVNTASFNARYREDGLIHAPSRCAGITVGRMPIITMCAPRSPARCSAALRLARTSRSSSRAADPERARGGTFNSML